MQVSERHLRLSLVTRQMLHAYTTDQGGGPRQEILDICQQSSILLSLTLA